MQSRSALGVLEVTPHLRNLKTASRSSWAGVVVMDEAAWFAWVDGSPLDADEVWDALVPATAQFPERRVLVLSTPRFASGWFAGLVERAESGMFPDLRA